MFSIYCENNVVENIDTVLLDKDGTLIDAHIYWGEIIKKRATKLINFYKINNMYFGKICLAMGYDVNTNKLVESGPIALLPRNDVILILQNFLKDISITTEYEDISAIFDTVNKEFLPYINDYVKLIDGSLSLLSDLKNAGAKLAVVTSDSSDNTLNILDFLDIKKYFDLIIGKDSCDNPKRSGKPAILAMSKLCSLPENTICIGDAKMDADMAQNANLKASILVATGQTSFNTLRKYSDFAVKSLLELKIK